MNSFRILLAANDPMLIESLSKALAQEHLETEVLIVRTRQALLEALERPGAPAGPAAIVLDLQATEIDGLAVLDEIRRDPAKPRVPVVTLAATAQDAERERCYELGANSYIRRPADADALTHALRHVAIFWTRVNEPPPGCGSRLPAPRPRPIPKTPAA
jgi:CheY-like chemotaxis protein